MKNMIATKFFKILTLNILFSTLSFAAFAQQVSSPTISDSSLVIGLFTCVMLLVVFLAAILGDKIIKVSDSKYADSQAENKLGLLPRMREVFPLGDSVVEGKKVVNLSKGFDIKVNGAARKEVKDFAPSTFAIKPNDFMGLQPIPKMMVKEGDKVKAGDKLFYDKGFDGVFFTAPVSGVIAEIRRGEKRAIEAIVINADGKNEFISFKKADPKSMTKEDVLSQVLESGAWIFFTERPFGVVASVEHFPKSIHISGFDTAPLSVDYNFVFKNIDQNDFQAGIDALNKLTNEVHLNLDASKEICSTFSNAKNVTKNYFKGAHPAGNVGIQIHHVDAIQKGEYIRTIKAEDVANLGKIFTKGIYEPTRFVALAGPIIKTPHYVKTLVGANIEGLINGNLTNENARVISGNILTGTKIEANGFLGFNDNLISVIEEGNHQEMFGWMVPQYARPSLSPTFPWKMIDFTRFDVNTNTHGEKRAFVVTGQYEEVMPMDIYPQHLMKAIIKNDFEEMEGLGIYEVIEEDVALCEFACTSKQPLQSILREGLDYIRSQN